MRKKVIAFGASNSRQSINKKLATYAANKIANADVNIVDLNDYEMPIYSIDREKESGIPQLAHAFTAAVSQADGIVVSFAEHNGSYTAAFKNIYDWISRISQDIWKNKPMLLLATSPGGRGAKSVLEQAENIFRRINKNTIVSFSLPSFSQNFSEDQGITDTELEKSFNLQLNSFSSALRRGN